MNILENQKTSITFVGHATMLIEMAGVRLLTDPILRDRITFLQRRGGPVDLGILQNIDAILISHLHYDHLDFPSLEKLGKEIPLIVPRGAGKLFHRNGFRFVEEMVVDETVTIKGVTIRATYAKHSTFRHPFGARAICLGFIMTGPYEIYFPGDTDLFMEMAHLSEHLDVALMPVWGWGPTLGPGHMNPLRAAQSLTLLQPRLAIPIHWGTLHPQGLGRLNPRRFLTEPPHLFARFAAEFSPEVKIHQMLPGESVNLEDL